MPKYFSDERPLPFERIDVSSSNVNSAHLAEVLAQRPSASLCIRFEGYGADSLGFVFHIRRNRAVYELLNITGEVELIAADVHALAEIMSHVAGIEFSLGVHAKFHASRNDIGRGEPLTHRLDDAMFSG